MGQQEQRANKLRDGTQEFLVQFSALSWGLENSHETSRGGYGSGLVFFFPVLGCTFTQLK